MGNNYCKAVGIVPGHPIHLSQFDQLWQQFDTKRQGFLSKNDAVNFLKEFAKATDTKYTSIKASTIIEDLLGPDGNMGKLAFEKLFLAMALEQKIMMSQSLLEELEFADGIAQLGLDSCRQGHSLVVTTPYNGIGWICDLCRLHGKGESNHCNVCGFDLCDRCRAGPKPHAAELNRTCILSFLQTLQPKRKEVPLQSLVGAHRPDVPSAVSGRDTAMTSSSPARPAMTEAAAKLVVSFAELVDGNYQVDTVGGKALKLAQVASAFRNSPVFAVPSGAAVTTRAYSRHIAQLDSQLVAAVWAAGDVSLLEPLRHAIEERPIDSETRDAIASFLKTLPADTTLAVRSSATAEDAADFSMAGLAETYLHIPNNLEEVCKHVRKCWTSLWQERVVSYIGRAAASSGTPATAPRMCVVLQQMVSAASAGVLFTLHPNTGDEEKMFIEALYGLGEGVVSGDINPTSYEGSWITRQHTVKHTPQKKKYVRTPGSFGTSVVSTTEAEQKNPPLSRTAVEKLLQLGVCVASHYGHPQDIEWAIDTEGRLFMTQTRPITEYSLNIDVGDDRWYPGFQEKTWLCVSMATMTGFSSLVKAFAPKYQGDVVRLYYGQAYASAHADGMFQAALRSLTVTKSLPARAKQTIAYCKHSQNQIEPTMWGLVGVLSTLLDSELHQLVTLMLGEMTEADFNSFLSGTLADNYLRTVQSWLKTLAERGLRDISVDALITGAHPNTGGAARLIREIAFAASQHSEAREFVLNTPSAEFVQKLSQRKDLEWLWADFSRFLRTYFWMCDIDEEVDSVHWLDNPTLPIESLRAELTKNKFQLMESGTEAYSRTFASLQQSAPQLLGQDKAERFFADLNALRTWLNCKEEVHETYGRSNYFAQKILLELGQRWAKAGHLRHAREIFDLGQQDVRECIASPELCKYLKENQLFHHQSLRAMFRRWKAPTLIQSGSRKLGRSQTCDDDEEGGGSLRGRAGARGRVTARARVILSLDQAAQVQPGEILVTQQTSPGWTPLFARIAGLVTEQGGILSHGAVVARECRIPAVLQVDNATKLIKTGQTITIDGDAGDVTFV